MTEKGLQHKNDNHVVQSTRSFKKSPEILCASDSSQVQRLKINKYIYIWYVMYQHEYTFNCRKYKVWHYQTHGMTQLENWKAQTSTTKCESLQWSTCLWEILCLSGGSTKLLKNAYLEMLPLPATVACEESVPFWFLWGFRNLFSIWKSAIPLMVQKSG